jgi:hypothetical protein
MKTNKFTFRGIDVEINEDALASFKVQKAIAQMETNVGKGFDALDVVFNGKLDELIDTIPDEDGKPYEYGAPADVVAELIQQAVESSSALKNA